MRKIFIQLCFLSLFCTLLNAESITGSFSISESDISYQEKGGYTKLKLLNNNAHESYEIGAPNIPYIQLTAVVPQNSIDISITLSNVSYRIIMNNITPYPVQKDFTSSDSIYPTLPNATLYNSNYPVNEGSLGQVTYLRGTKLVNFRINPLKYNGTLKTLELAEDINYAINFSIAPTAPIQNYSYNNIFAENLSTIVINPEDLDNYSSVSNPENRSTTSPVDFLIITSNKLKSAFMTYAAFRSSERNFKTEVITVEDIYSQYTGATNQIKIKACIKDYVENKNLIYVMFGGDIGEVGYQPVWGKTQGITIPSDLFFSCLDGDITWNSNGNDKIGEDEDNCDRVSDVILGRLPVNSAQEVYQYMQKITNYKNGYVNSFRKENIFFFNGGYQNNNEFKIHRADIDNMLNEIYPYTWPSFKATDDALLTIPEFTDRWNEGHSTVFLANHGLEDLILLKGWGLETGVNFKNEHVDNLTNVANVVYTTACRTTSFEYDVCFAEKMVLAPNAGTLTYIGASREAYFGASGKYCRFFAKHLTANPSNPSANTIGNAFKNAAAEYAIKEPSDEWDLYIKNLLGDPTLVILEDEFEASFEEIIQPNNDNIKDAAIASNGTIYAVTTNNQNCYIMTESGSWGILPPLNNKNIISIAIDNQDYLWATTDNASVYRLTGRSWQLMPGSGWDIAANSKGDICLLGTNDVYKWNGSQWNSLNWNGNNSWNPNYTELGITVDESGDCWVIDPLRDIYRYNGNWEKVPGKASNIASFFDGLICIDNYQIWGGYDWIKFDKSQYFDGYLKPIGSDFKRNLFLKNGSLYWLHTAENIIEQGYFPGEYWHVWGDEGILTLDYGNYGYEVNDEPTSTISAAKLSVVNGGGNELWSALFAQEVRSTIYKGDKFRVSFWAKQEVVEGSNSEILVTVSMKESPWTEYGALTVNLTEEYKRYEFEFTMEDETDNNAIIQFCVGKYNRNINIENVYLERIKPVDNFVPNIPQINYLLYDQYEYSVNWEPSLDNYSVDYYNVILNYSIKTPCFETEFTNTLNNNLAANRIQLQSVDESGNMSACLNVDGSSDGSRALELKPIKEDLYTPIISKFFQTTENSISISWDAIDNSENLKEYKVNYIPLDFYNAPGSNKYISVQDNQIELTNLRNSTLYKISVTADLVSGTDTYHTIYIRTGIGDYEEPLRFPAWDSSVAYWGGEKVSYNGKIWEAKWWTQNEVPGTASVWVEISN